MTQFEEPSGMAVTMSAGLLLIRMTMTLP